MSCYTILETAAMRHLFVLPCIVCRFEPALDAYSRSARAPLLKLLVTARTWPSPPASTPT
eukprot:5023062-Pleurochrysis_carterae.AAC.3